LCSGDGDGHSGGDGLADGLDQLCRDAFLYNADDRPVGDIDRYGGVHGWVIFICSCRVKYKYINGSDHAVGEHTRHVHIDVHRTCICRLCFGNGDGDGSGDGLADGIDQLCGYAFLYNADDRAVGDVDRHGGVHGRLLFICSCRIKYKYINGCDHTVDEHTRYLHSDIHDTCFCWLCGGDGDGYGGGNGLADGYDFLCI
jgi:hypothetical protein